MRIALEIAALTLTALAMVPALAHALEYPGKMRLAREDYLTVQRIYYPGFTFAGLSEPFAVLVLGTLLAFTPTGAPAFWLTAGSFAAAVLTHLIYWTLTAPVNKVWLRDETLSRSAGRFFGSARQEAPGEEWTLLRDRWERSHLARAATAAVSFVLLAVAAVT